MAQELFTVNFADFADFACGPGVDGVVEDSEGDGEAEVPREMCPVLEPNVGTEDLVSRMRVTAEEAEMIERYDQGTTEWLLSRRGTQTRLPDGQFYSDTVPKPLRFLPGRLTASNFGTAVGHNKYSGAGKLIEDMLWGVVVSNDAMRYGSEMEPVACDVFETALFFLTGGGMHVEHRGLMLACPALYDVESNTYEGWCGTSPDGIINWKQSGQSGQSSSSTSAHPSPSTLPPPPLRSWAHPTGHRSLLEIKCPSVNKRNFYSERYGNERFGIPHYYYDQIMGICGLQHLSEAFFVVHLPDRTQVLKYTFDAAYFAELFSGMRRFWFEQYLPAALACARGKLVKGEIAVREENRDFEEPDMELEEDVVAKALAEGSAV